MKNGGVSMQKENYVSLWLGKIKSKKEMNKYLRIKYTRDGDFIPSKFAKDFMISRYDDDFREAEVLDDLSSNAYELLDGFSYDESIIPYFKNIIEKDLSDSYNTVILLYNFEYDDSVLEVNNEIGYIKFIGKTKYCNI